MKIWIDAKNASSQNAGIALWSEYHLSLCDAEFNSNLQLVYPFNSRYEPYSDLNIKRKKLFSLKKIPSVISTILYDLFTFRIYAKFCKPDLIFSPYYDVLLPKHIPSIISIHDLCYVEQPKLYSKLRRHYFIWIMKTNASRCKLILTVSQTSKKQISKYLNIDESKILVLPNVIKNEFISYVPNRIEIHQFRSKCDGFDKVILYTGGFENRKNIPMLLEAINLINSNGSHICLVISGIESDNWTKAISNANINRNSILFLGYLTDQQLKVAYKSVDAVVYPSLSEGFGRSCIEAMASQTPLLCSDIPVFREVAGDYPYYFDPNNLQNLIVTINRILSENKPSENLGISQIDSNLNLQYVMKEILNGK